MIHVNFVDITTEIINNTTDSYIESKTMFNAELVDLNNDMLSRNNFIKIINYFDHCYNNLSYIFIMKSLHTNSEIRKTCSDCNAKILQFRNNENMDHNIFNKFKYYYDNQYLLEKTYLTYEENILIEKYMQIYECSGIEFAIEKRDKIIKIKDKLIKLSADYCTNVNNYNKKIIFTKDDLSNMDHIFLLSTINEDNISHTIIINQDYYSKILTDCSNRKTRETMLLEYNKRCCDTNKSIINKIFKLRHKLAKIYGFDSFSDYKLSENMINNTNDAMEFLNDLKDEIKPIFKKDCDELLKLAHLDKLKDLQVYDILYYKKKYIDTYVGNYYFEIDDVTNGLLKIFGSLFGIEFINVTDNFHKTKWHDDIKIYKIKSESCIESYLIFDIYSRIGKNTGYCIYGSLKDKLPTCIISCNFNKKYTLSLSGIQLYFHEFGHAMHYIFSGGKMDVTPDAIEIPSELFEEWCFSKKVLKIINSKLTNYDIKQIQKLRNMMNSNHITFQLCGSFIDIIIHNKYYNCDYDYNKLYSKIRKEITDIDFIDDHSFIESFRHLVIGYASEYYGYLYSKSIAKYIYDKKFKNHETDIIVGNEYITKVLKTGNTKNFKEIIIDFLGYFPSNKSLIATFY
jgi:Zn-dependent oligopeptidase